MLCSTHHCWFCALLLLLLLLLLWFVLRGFFEVKGRRGRNKVVKRVKMVYCHMNA